MPRVFGWVATFILGIGFYAIPIVRASESLDTSDEDTAVRAIGAHLDVAKMPAHWLMARLGKRVLRPGGLDTTRWLLQHAGIRPEDDVVEFAPGLAVRRPPAWRSGPEPTPESNATSGRRTLRSTPAHAPVSVTPVLSVETLRPSVGRRVGHSGDRRGDAEYADGGDQARHHPRGVAAAPARRPVPDSRARSDPRLARSGAGRADPERPVLGDPRGRANRSRSRLDRVAAGGRLQQLKR